MPRFAVSMLSVQNSALLFVLTAYNSQGKEFFTCGRSNVHVIQLTIYKAVLALKGKSVCFCKVKNNQKFGGQGSVVSKGRAVKNLDPIQYYFHHLDWVKVIPQIARFNQQPTERSATS